MLRGVCYSLIKVAESICRPAVTAQKTGGADLATADSYEAFHAEMMVEADRLAKREITWGVYNERCLERGTKSWEELKTRLAAIQNKPGRGNAATMMMLCGMGGKAFDANVRTSLLAGKRPVRQLQCS